jgi:ADP-heptose:LPS heptosyltransferase
MRDDPEAVRTAIAGGWVKSVLALRVARVGDTLHVLPALELLRGALPEARITFVCSDYAAAVGRGAPVDAVVPYPHKGRSPAAVVARRAARAALRAAGPFDLCLGLLWHSESVGGVHVVERKAGVLTPLGLWEPGQGPPPPIRWRSARAPLPLPGPPPHVGLQVGSHATRNWVAPRRRRDPTPGWLVETAFALHRNLGATPVVHGGSRGVEQRNAEAVGRELEARGVPHAVLLDLDLEQLGATLATLDAFVSANTGPAHIAAAAGVPVVLLDGPAPREVAPPWRAGALRRVDLGLSCSPCRGTAHGRACRVPRCIDEIRPASVAQAVGDLLAEGG